MQMKCHFRWAMLLLLAGIVSVLLSSCQTTPPAVIAVTGTNFGLEISQNAATQTPQIKLGYNRGEIAIVSKDKFKDDDAANVLMEFGYGGSTSNSIYQRLAVGKDAVTAGGAQFMFLKNSDGNLNPEAVQKAKEAINAIKGD